MTGARRSAILLAFRSILWTAVLPGGTLVYLPWIFGLREARLDFSRPALVPGLVLAGLGALVLIVCIVDFARRGRGTLSPVDPPRELVVRGLYRYVRNPMYVGAVILLAGEVLISGARGVLVYAVIWFACANLFVMTYEEPILRRQFGVSYRRYTEKVGRWIPTWPHEG